MGNHKKIGDTIWGSFPSGDTFSRADGTKSTFFQTDVWRREKSGTPEKLFEFYVHNDGTKLFRFDEKRLKELGFKVETNMG